MGDREVENPSDLPRPTWWASEGEPSLVARYTYRSSDRGVKVEEILPTLPALDGCPQETGRG